MLLKRRPPRIDPTRPIEINPGFQHLDRNVMVVLRWLKENKVDFVLVGPVAEAVHTRSGTSRPVAIVPAPYGRNMERLARALNAGEARMRDDDGTPDPHPAPTGRITEEHLMMEYIWTLWCGPYPIDVVGTAAPTASGAAGASGYQELLYEAIRFDLSPEITVEVASPEDIEHYSHLRRTGSPPEMTVSRQRPALPRRPTHPTRAPGTDRAATGAPGHGSPPGSG
ncbi:MAG: hypothetical protein ACJ764_10195 [Solirubrobacteraceae bacterium]